MLSPGPLSLMAACAAGGVLAAVLGLGGGIFVVPLLVLWVGLPPTQAAAASLVCGLATSAGGSIALDRTGRVDYRLVIQLEVFAALGALVAAWASSRELVPARALNALFGVVLLLVSLRMLAGVRRGSEHPTHPEDAGLEVGPGRQALARALAALAGSLSGLLGIGGGPVKVPLQTEVLRVPLPVALANSNLMVGITTGFGAAVHFGAGTIPAVVTGPCALGMALGAYLGGRLAPRLRVRWLTAAFVIVLLYVAGRMLWKALQG